MDKDFTFSTSLSTLVIIFLCDYNDPSGCEVVCNYDTYVTFEFIRNIKYF